MGFIKRENKKFDYQPRYYKGDNPYKFKHKFDEYRTTVGKRKGIKGKFIAAFEEFKSSEYGGLNKTIVIAIVIMLLLFLYIIDFDLSIFIPRN